ncbi:MAG: preprotein translocase subunit SecY [Ruminococcaceae bacterium]|nr:preprotein translocase subunit SecY [Oscillospiraceae bacterium]
MFRTLANAWKIPDLKKKLLFTLFIVLIYRVGACLPVPFVESGALLDSFDSSSILGFVSILSGSAFEYSTLFALGVSPYITASIVIQLLTIAIPALERLAKRGEEGKDKIAQITRYITIAISIITGIGYYFLLRNYGAIRKDYTGVFFAFVIVACFVAGSSLVMWLAEKVNEKGIGNGISIILFANIVSRVPSALIGFIANLVNSIGGAKVSDLVFSIVYPICYLILLLAMMWFIIYITDSERRIPVQYAKKVVGRKMYGGQSSNLPIKLNMTGVMPIIFANAILTLPATIAMFFDAPEEGTFWHGFLNIFASTSWVYVILQFVLIVAFAYFYVAISFNPIEVSGNLQKNGGSIPGIRPGKATSDFISKVLSRITLIGALFLSIVSVLPLVIHLIMSYIPVVKDYSGMFSSIAFSGTSIIIVVGVILETVRDMEAQMTMRHYKGFLE